MNWYVTWVCCLCKFKKRLLLCEIAPALTVWLMSYMVRQDFQAPKTQVLPSACAAGAWYFSHTWKQQYNTVSKTVPWHLHGGVWVCESTPEFEAGEPSVACAGLLYVSFLACMILQTILHLVFILMFEITLWLHCPDWLYSSVTWGSSRNASNWITQLPVGSDGAPDFEPFEDPQFSQTYV